MPVAVGGQTERPVDDVAARLADGGLLLVQAKKGLRLDTGADRPLAEALAQVVQLDSAGVPDEGFGGNRTREVDVLRDLVAIFTDETASGPVRIDLAAVTDRLRDLPDGEPLSESARTASQERAREVLLDHVRRLARVSTGGEPTDTDLRRITRSLCVHGLDLVPGGREYETAIGILQSLAGNTQPAAGVWTSLTTRMQQVAEDQTWRRRDALVVELEQDGIFLDPVSRLRPDLERLRERTADNLGPAKPSLQLTVPEGVVELARDVDRVVLGVNGNFAVTGDPGAGKTVVLHHLARHLIDEGQDVVLLTADDLAGLSRPSGQEFSLEHEIGEVLLSWRTAQPGTLLLDGLDQATSAGTSTWLPTLTQRLIGSRWRVVASVRSYDLRYGAAWRRMFAGGTIDPARTSGGLSGVAHVLIGDLSPDEIHQLCAASPATAGLLAAADERVKRLLANPFNLSLAVQLLTDGQLPDLRSINRRADLLGAYWSRRIELQPDRLQRRYVLNCLVEAMLSARQQRLTTTAGVLQSADMSSLTGLLSDGVLHEQPGRRASAPKPITFAHPVLFDYAVAELAFGDPDRPDAVGDRLDRDPDLALAVRPSLEYRLADVWEIDADRSSFWRLALRLHSSVNGHPLASAAAARVVAYEATGIEDLAGLITACTPGSMPDDRSSQSDALMLTYVVATALIGHQAEEVDRQRGLGLLTQLTERLAEAGHEADDLNLARLSVVILNRLPHGSVAAQTRSFMNQWARSAALALSTALAQPSESRRQILATAAAMAASSVVAFVPEMLVPIVKRLADSEVMTQWGVTPILRVLPALPSLAVADPDAVVEIASSVWRFDETSDEPTTLGDSLLLRFSSTRRADADHARWEIVSEFPSLLRAAPLTGIALLLRLIESDDVIDSATTGIGSEPTVRHGRPLSLIGDGQTDFGEVVQAVAAELDGLANTDPADGHADPMLDDAIELLQTQMTHSEAWQKLLDYAAARGDPSLGHRFLPLLLTPSGLLRHSQTWDAAGRLAARLSPSLSEEQHEALERAVLHATSVDDADGDLKDDADDDVRRSMASKWLIDRRGRLLGSFGRDALRSAEARNWLDDAESTGRALGALPSPSSAEAMGMAYPFDEQLNDLTGGSTVSEPARECLRLVDAAVQQAHSSQPGEREQGVAALFEALPQLDSLLSDSEQESAIQGELRRNLLTAAEILTGYPSLMPDTEVGKLVLRTLTDVLNAPPRTRTSDAESELEDHGASTLDELNGQVDSSAPHAIDGLGNLLGRAEWSNPHGAEIRRFLVNCLDSNSPTVRGAATRWVLVIFPDASGALAEIEQRLTGEQEPPIQAVLIQALASVANFAPADADEVIGRLAAQPHWSAIAESSAGDTPITAQHPLDSLIKLIVDLAVGAATARARQSLSAWVNDPVANGHRVVRASLWLGRLVNAPGGTSASQEDRGFAFLQQAASGVSQAWQDISADDSSTQRLPSRDTETTAIVEVAEEIVKQLHFASGAMHQAGSGQPPRGDNQKFAVRALSVFEHLGAIPHPRVTHYIIQTLSYLIRHNVEPRRCYLVAANAVQPDNGYEYEPLAVQEVMQMIDHVVADHHDLLLSDQECLAATRRLLAVFVRVGRDEAIQRAIELDAIFR